jgi:hypothetical protein
MQEKKHIFCLYSLTRQQAEREREIRNWWLDAYDITVDSYATLLWQLTQKRFYISVIIL